MNMNTRSAPSPAAGKLPDLKQYMHVQAIIERALEEDVGPGDATTTALVEPSLTATADIVAREACRVSGVAVAEMTFHAVDPNLKTKVQISDGSEAAPDDVLLTIQGSARGILIAERTALNLMQRMCGIATETARCVAAVGEWRTSIVDTRKTTPGLRVIEKYSVLCGGGRNHRMGLYDQVLIKDNHRALWQGGDPTQLDQAIEAARARFPGIPIEIEVETIEELRSALRARPDWVLLDNMTPELMRECVALARGSARTEASGGIRYEKLREIAATGVDAISLGCLTHSVRSIDLSLEWRREALRGGEAPS